MDVTAGRIEVICGPMFSGKTEELIRRLRRAVLGRQKVQAFKPKIDSRYHVSRVTTHAGDSIDATPVATVRELERSIAADTKVVGIDEVQFFGETRGDALTYAIVLACQTLSIEGRRVIVAGLDMNYRAEPFGPVPHLLAVGSPTKLTAVCAGCGGEATHSRRLMASGPEVHVGGAAEYRAQCLACYVRPT